MELDDLYPPVSAPLLLEKFWKISSSTLAEALLKKYSNTFVYHDTEGKIRILYTKILF